MNKQLATLIAPFVALLLSLVLYPSLGMAQYGNTVITHGTGAPSGTCSFVRLYINDSNNDLYKCPGGTWVLIGSVTGTGTSGTIPKFTGAAVLGNSLWTDNGTTTTYTGTGGAAVNPGTTPAEAFNLDIAALTGAGTRNSHWERQEGHGYDTSDHQVDWIRQVSVTSNAGASTFLFRSRIDAAAYGTRFSFDDAGNATVPTTLTAQDIVINSGRFDFTEIAAPANPAASTCRLYADSTLKSLAGLDSNGANCLARSSVNTQTGITYTVLTTDRGKLVTHTNAAAIAVTLPQANSTTFSPGWHYDTQNRGAGTVTITPTTSTVDGAASLALTTDQGVRIFSDGTNYFTQRGIGGSGAPTTATYVTTSTNATLTAEQVLTAGKGIAVTAAGGDGGNVTVDAANAFAQTSIQAGDTVTTTNTDFATTYTIPANTLAVGTVVDIYAAGLQTVDTTGRNADYRVKFGSTVVLAQDLAHFVNASETNRGWYILGKCITITTGATGTVECQGSANLWEVAGTFNARAMTNTATVTINTTTTQVVAINANWNIMAGTDATKMRQLIISIKK